MREWLGLFLAGLVVLRGFLKLHSAYCACKWEALRDWLEAEGHWTPAFLEEKGPDYPFPLEFVETGLVEGFLWRQYQQARAAVDEGYCLGADCLGCGVCTPEQRAALTGHQMRLPEDVGYLADLERTVREKRRLKPCYVRVRLPEEVAGATPAWIHAYLLRRFLALLPHQAENLLAARESLFTVGENAGRFPGWYGETICALTAWDAGALVDALAALPEGSGLYRGPAEGFCPGEF